MKILITGGCGFIGTNFVRFLIRERPSCEITVIDKLTYAGNIENIRPLKNRVKFVKCDIRDRKIQKIAKGADAIINFAAETHVDRSITDPQPFLASNVFGVYNLIEAARKNDLRFVQISTDEVYGSIKAGSFKETDRLSPSNPYSATKAAGDHLTLSYVNTYGTDAVITRCSNNFGPFQNTEKLIPKAITNALKNKTIPVYGTGGNIRDWIFVDDHCGGVLAALEKGTKGEIYNIAGGNENTNMEIVKMILKITGRPFSLLKLVQDRPGHDFRYSVNCSKIGKLGWKRKHTTESALSKTVDWYRENVKFWGKT